MARSGFTVLAVTVAPRDPNSSWTANAPVTSTFSVLSRRLSRVRRMEAQPRRQSKALPIIRSCFSWYSKVTSGTTGAAMRTRKSRSTSSREEAPMSMLMSSTAGWALRSASLIKWGGLLAVTPGI